MCLNKLSERFGDLYGTDMKKCPSSNMILMKCLNWPAAAVIPAPIAYIKVVAVKKLVVEPWTWLICPPHRAHGFGRIFPSGEPYALHWV